MSKKRHLVAATPPNPDDGIAVRTFAARHSSGYVVPRHTHAWHQLIYASEGVMWVHTSQGDWVVPPNRAVWVPAGVEHAIDMVGTVLVQTLYIASGICGPLPRRCCAVNVSPLLRELIRHIITLGFLDQTVPARTHLIGLLVDQLVSMPAIPLQLPLPSDERAKRAAAWMRAHPDNPGLIKQLAKRVAISPRTLERLFQKDTGMTFGKWRQQLRLLHALRQLAAGKPVTAVALEVGYDSPSAFIAMFRRTLGTTPYRYFAASSGERFRASPAP
jgi:AraC-like DNA-binding protein